MSQKLQRFNTPELVSALNKRNKKLPLRNTFEFINGQVKQKYGQTEDQRKRMRSWNESILLF